MPGIFRSAVIVTQNNDKTGYSGVVTSGTVNTVTGNVNGSLLGDIGGSVAGNVNGSLLGNVNGSIVGNVNASVLGSLGGNVNGSVLGNVVGTVDVVKRIQRGNVAINNGFSIGTSTLPNAVVMLHTEVRMNGYKQSGNDPPTLKLLNTTQLRAERFGTSGDTAVEYEVTEYVRVTT